MNVFTKLNARKPQNPFILIFFKVKYTQKPQEYYYYYLTSIYNAKEEANGRFNRMNCEVTWKILDWHELPDKIIRMSMITKVGYDWWTVIVIYIFLVIDFVSVIESKFETDFSDVIALFEKNKAEMKVCTYGAIEEP